MQVRNLYRSVAATFFLLALMAVSAKGQLNYQEGFNDDGDGTRYTLFGRGFELLGVDEVPSMWEHSFLSPEIGLACCAPARRAGILWTHDVQFAIPPDADIADEAYDVWTNLVNWAVDGKQNARIGFYTSYGENNAAFQSLVALQELFEDQGHTVMSIPDVASIPDPADIDLIIHTSESAVDPPTIFSEYPVPGIFFNSGNHDDTLIAKIGQVYPIEGALSLNVVAENASHPILQGLPNPVPWTTDFATGMMLHGMGDPAPGGEVLLTFLDDMGVERPALVVVEEGAALLGSFTPTPEGAGYIVGASLEDFNTDVIPKVLELNPVDISGQSEDVMMTVALAATDADFEPADYLRIFVGESGALPEEFVLLDEFLGVDDAGGPFNKAMSRDGGVTGLSSAEFTDYTWNISQLAPDITNLVVRFEGFNTFGNEIYGIDNVRIFAGEIMPPEGIPGDYNNNGTVEQADLDLVLLNWGQPGVPNGWTNDLPEGNIDQAELDGVLLNWGNMAALGSAAGVPEPSTLALVILVLSAAAFRIRVRLRAR